VQAAAMSLELGGLDLDEGHVVGLGLVLYMDM
jgi:hypothetical protein